MWLAIIEGSMQTDIEDIPGESDSGNQERLHYEAP